MASKNPPTPAPQGEPQPLLISLKVAAKVLGLSEKLVWSMARAGELPCVRARRRIMFSPEQLKLWVKQNTEGGPR